VKDPTKLKVTNHRRKTIQTRKRNIQCQCILSHWEGSALLFLNIKYYHTWIVLSIVQ